LSKTNKTTTAKEVLRKILDCLPTDFAVFDPNHKYLESCCHKNKELREYIVGKDDFEYAHTNRTDDFAIERRTKFNKAIQRRDPIMGRNTL
jgi:hypothetical protein